MTLSRTTPNQQFSFTKITKSIFQIAIIKSIKLYCEHEMMSTIPTRRTFFPSKQKISVEKLFFSVVIFPNGIMFFLMKFLLFRILFLIKDLKCENWSNLLLFSFSLTKQIDIYFEKRQNKTGQSEMKKVSKIFIAA